MFKLARHATSRTITTPDAKSANAIYKFLKANPDISSEAIADKLKSLGIIEPSIKSQIVEEGKSNISIAQASVSEPLKVQNTFVISQLYNIQPERMRAFEECRGYVVAAYQDTIEKKWMKDLRSKYPVVVNQQVFDKMVKKQ